MKNIITNSDYMVTICGYEGIDAIFGPFKKEIAYEFFLELKKVFNEKNLKEEDEYFYKSEDEDSGKYPLYIDCNHCSNYYFNSSRKEQIPEKYGLFDWPKTDQLCIMRSNKKMNEPIHCVCEEFPDRPVMKQGWLY